MKFFMLAAIILHFAGVLVGLRPFKLTGRNFLMSLFWAVITLVGILELAVYRHLAITSGFENGTLIIILSLVISSILFVASVLAPYLFDTLITKEKAQKTEDVFDAYEHSPLGYQSLDQQGNFIDVNQSWLEALGYEKVDVIGKNFADFLNISDKELFRSNFEKFKKTGNIDSVRFNIKHKDGSIRVVEFDGRIAHDSQKNFKHTHCVMRDITDIYKAEKEKQNLIRLLAEKNNELENYIHATSHDLRTPIVNIEGFSKELVCDCNQLRQICRDCDTNEERRRVVTKILHNNIPESLGFIQKSTEKIDKLFAGLTEIAKLGSSRVNIELVDANEIVDAVINNMNFVIKDTDIDIVVGQLPCCYADNLYLDRVFTNLISNAVKYLDNDRPGKIEISGEKLDDHSIYCVQDNGIGIDEDLHDDVFKIFKRLNPEHAEQGEGIGLNIVKRIIDRHNGRVWFESQKGKGSKFYVSLPDIKN